MKKNVSIEIGIVVPNDFAGKIMGREFKKFLEESKKISSEKIIIMEMTPYELASANIPEGIKKIYVIGISLRNPGKGNIERFLEKNLERISFWVDSYRSGKKIDVLEKISKEKRGFYYEENKTGADLLNEINKDILNKKEIEAINTFYRGVGA